MKSALVAIGCLAGFCALALSAERAEAACPGLQVVFVFDQSGSMQDTGSTGQAKYLIAAAKAKTDYDALKTGALVSIMTYGNYPQFTSPYANTVIPLSAGRVKGTNDASFKAAIDAAAVPGNLPTGYWTPLAGAVCDAIDYVWMDDPTCPLDAPRDLYLYSDGLENSTPNATANPNDADFNPCKGTVENTGTFDPNAKDTGFGLTDNSWQWKVANKAWTGSPDNESIPGAVPVVMNVSLLFSYTTAATRSLDGGGPAAGLQETIPDSGIQFFKGLTIASLGSYFEAKKVWKDGVEVPTVTPQPGDTDPSETRSCVDQADISRVKEALGKKVTNNDQTLPKLSGEDLARRDVNNDMLINNLDYQMVIKYYGKGVCN